ncbi:type II toxin-antitoxin system VapC family toxin [Variovorax robiniae]|uniref:Ribonuclease VapC n=1 Tax=Variovorax robiniae TaxID=1836199 RepID=A0ABU8XF71_9BURK
MIGLDTNVLVRYLAQDDARQSAIATRLIEDELNERRPGFVSLVVLVELCWVLERLYAATPREIVDTVADMLTAAHFEFQEREAVRDAIDHFRGLSGARPGLPDILIAKVAFRHACGSVVSFDRAAVRAAGMTLLA